MTGPARAAGHRRTLVVTNDFPPRQGGIQSFVHEMALRQPPGSIVVHASDHAGAADFDAAQPFPVVRHGTGLLLPTPAVRARAVALLREHGCSAVWFGAAAPLGLLAPALRAAGAERVLAMTHGHEAGWAMLPGARQALRRIGDGADVVTYLGEYFRRRLRGPLGRHAELVQLTPGVDVETFRSDVDGTAVRARHGLADRPTVVCVSRLVPRKGQDVLVRALPLVRREIPDAALLLVGGGPYRDRLVELAGRHGVAPDVVVTGAVAQAELPAHYAAGDVFAMPCRTRRLGMDVEGLGIVFLEASATGLPVVVGDSGGAPDAVRDGETGYVVDGRDEHAVADRLVTLLRDDALRARMGAAGRAWVERDWRWDVLAGRLRALLDG
ncbi:phosphatidylinositol alpha-1,6-mannosyltransferase [Jatrophihabitans endophyticus]|uniref:phosphatidyl-myo-inositol dimannoside synthase n=1 Tax=Jatrophihabitans endophyticus TaxID=1206085 RepID=A0A1M5L3G9_9ACTN|nr:glycosyltransferase family 4 protein [Jatrophihabitans endophyticus]SHG59558.1 phosphatidylinositol alpha-1,6-mannosyltransferase [Jatrophihabitans endophyticus]